MEANAKQQVVERIQNATNILVTVSKNPTVDQLSACIGFTLLLNKYGKHATAVYSGVTPSTIEFLQPEKTLEATTDSLRDFIIALDKSKADKLRYKVEDDVVRIFITPYKTSISDKDLEFSQGDFNVDVVVAIGVSSKDDIDQAIVAHGRILHDAVVVGITNGHTQTDIGSINWHDTNASSLCEMLVSASESFQDGIMDGQMATAFLTGIVAETDRFSNDKTSPRVMTMSAKLMAAGANQQLIATKLTEAEAAESVAIQEITEPGQEPEVVPYMPPGEETPVPQLEPEQPKADGEIEIPHEEEPAEEPEVSEEEVIEEEIDPDEVSEIHIDDQGNLKLQEEIRLAEEEAAKKAALETGSDGHKVIQPINADKLDPLAAYAPTPVAAVAQPVAQPAPTMTDQMYSAQATVDATLQSTLQQPVTEVSQMPSPSEPAPAVPEAQLDEARQAVQTAALDSVPRPQATQSVGAQIIDINTPPAAPQPAMTGVGDVLQQTSVLTPDPVQTPLDPMAPPPVPPPMMPEVYASAQNTHAYLDPKDEPKPAENQDMAM